MSNHEDAPSLETFIAAIEMMPPTFDVPQLRIVQHYLADESRVKQFFKAIDDGLQLSSGAIGNSRYQGVAEQVAVRYWTGTHRYEDDEKFSPTRFLLMSGYWKNSENGELLVPKSVVEAAAAQVRRLLMSGMMHVDALEAYENFVADNQLLAEHALILAHDPWRLQQIRESLASSMPAFFSDTSWAERIKKTSRYRRLLVPLAEHELDQAFVNNWLRAALNETEYTQVRHFAPTILRDLYSAAWQEGYAGYHRRVAGSV